MFRDNVKVCQNERQMGGVMKRERSDDYAGSLGRLSPAGLKHGPLVVGMDWDYKMALDLFTQTNHHNQPPLILCIMGCSTV